MSSIEALKEQARRHEQKEEWPKALDLYKKAIQQLAAVEEPDIGLYNRVADIQVRQGQIEDAVLNYEQAIDLYVEAELPNNAIGVCKKIVRNMPMRHSVYLRMGQIRGRQGFVTDARQNFLIYAERMQAEGNVDEGLRALIELADLAPEDVEIRLAIAAQMQGHQRIDDAIEQLQAGYRQAVRRGLDSAPFEAKLRELGAEPSEVPEELSLEPTSLTGGDVSGFGDIVLADEPAAPAPPPAAPPAPAAPAAPPAAPSEDAGLDVGAFEIAPAAAAAPEEEQQEQEEAAPLPMLDFASDEDGEEVEAEPLPMLAGDDEDDDAAPLPLLADDDGGAPGLDAAAFGERDLGDRESSPYVAGPAELPEIEVGLSLDSGDDRGAGPGRAREGALEEARAEARTRPAETDPMGHESLAARGDLAGAMGSLGRLVRGSPDDLGLRQRMVDYAVQRGDQDVLVTAWVDLAETLERVGQAARARPVWEQVLSVRPDHERAREGSGQGRAAPAAAASDDYVDLGSMLLDDEGEKTTRFVVAYEEPSGDEQADFAKMLSQFKAKVAENLGSDDVRAHHDLGTAYKEMGLVDEAISEFQQALRASATHLPTYEVLGQCFMEKGEPEAALRTLKRALDLPYEIEDELLGIYYHLGRTHEVLGNKDQAVEFYDRVFSLDINFADVTERLRALR